MNQRTHSSLMQLKVVLLTEDDRLEELDSPRKEIVEHLREQCWNILLAGKHGVREKHGKKGAKEYVFEFTGEKQE